MIAKTIHLNCNLLAVGMAVALVALLGCGTHEKAKDGEPTHGDHPAKTGDKHPGHDGENGISMLMISTEPAEILPAQPVQLNLMIHDASGSMVKEFETVHEMKVHLIIVRDGLDQFAHIHPEIDPAGNISATFNFPTAGKYRLYADHKPVGKSQAVAIAEVDVTGTPPPKGALVPNTPGRVKADGLGAEIAVENAKAGEMTRISFTLLDAGDKPVTDLRPYLGAMGHLVVLSADGKQFVHSHPAEGKSSGGTVAFEAHFPQPGIYKGWGQFQRLDAVHNVPFVVEVK